MEDAPKSEAGGRQQTFEIGDVVPDFSLPGTDGASAQLSQLVSSQRIVLLFYRGHW